MYLGHPLWATLAAEIRTLHQVCLTNIQKSLGRVFFFTIESVRSFCDRNYFWLVLKQLEILLVNLAYLCQLKSIWENLIYCLCFRKRTNMLRKRKHKATVWISSQDFCEKAKKKCLETIPKTLGKKKGTKTTTINYH